jgi:hypothetical protein
MTATLSEKSPPKLPPLPDNVDTLVDQFVRLRDQIKVLNDAHKEKIAGAVAYMEQLNGKLMEQLNAIGGDSVQTPSGTAYRKITRSASIADGQAFREYIIEHELWDLADWKANAPAVDAFIKDNTTPPPGVNFSTFMTIGVRRANEK